MADNLVHKELTDQIIGALVLNPANEAQLNHYLKATAVEVGLLLNFGVKPEFRRKCLSNDRKRLRAK